MFDCLIAGEANVDLLVEGVLDLAPGKERLASDVALVLGGSSAITAFNLSQTGVAVRFVAVLGKDAFGEFVSDRLRAARVDVSAVRWHPTDKTGITIWHSKDRERAGVTYPGTISELEAEDVTEETLVSARHLHVGAYFLLRKLHPHAPELFARAKAAGLTTSLDCNYDPAERWDSNIWGVLKHTDVFFPNEQEARQLTGCDDPPSAALKLVEYATVVVVKLGDQGALIVSRRETFHQPAIRTTVVDTTGAGDSFNAGFLSLFLRGASLAECAYAGAQAAARSVTKMGGTAAFESEL